MANNGSTHYATKAMAWEVLCGMSWPRARAYGDSQTGQEEWVTCTRCKALLAAGQRTKPVPPPVPAGTEREALASVAALCDEAEGSKATWYYPPAGHRTSMVPVYAIRAALAAVVSSSPATPARHPGDEANPAIDALKASSARIAAASPATPEGGHDERCAKWPPHRHHGPTGQWVEPVPAASTLPAETREGRCPGALNVKGEHYTCDNQYPHDGWACSNGYLGALWQGTAASPAVSLPGEGDDYSGEDEFGSESWYAAPPPIPGEQPGGQER